MESTIDLFLSKRLSDRIEKVEKEAAKQRASQRTRQPEAAAPTGIPQAPVGSSVSLSELAR